MDAKYRKKLLKEFPPVEARAYIKGRDGAKKKVIQAVKNLTYVCIGDGYSYVRRNEVIQAIKNA
jgi:hypothetical protein